MCPLYVGRDYQIRNGSGSQHDGGSNMEDAPDPARPATLMPDANLCRLLASALDKLRRGMLVTDPELQILYCNEAAGEILVKADAVVSVTGRLVFRHRPTMRRLEDYLATAPGGDGKKPDLALRLERSNGDRAYRMGVSPLSLAPDSGRPDTYLVMIFDPHTARRIEGKVLIALYGLTPAEACVATRLFQGLTVGEAAVDMQISTNTARTHLRSVFRKCEVDSQSQLLQLMSLGPCGY
jgi:DNA-binding CsgD family transcriptional regulator